MHDYSDPSGPSSDALRDPVEPHPVQTCNSPWKWHRSLQSIVRGIRTDPGGSTRRGHLVDSAQPVAVDVSVTSIVRIRVAEPVLVAVGEPATRSSSRAIHFSPSRATTVALRPCRY